METTTQSQVEPGPACDLPSADAPRPLHKVLTEGCCIDEETVDLIQPAMHRRARAARAGVGLAQLALGGTLASRKLPGGVALWPVALIPTWYGISHLIAGLIGYRGCPELGAIPTVMQGRPVGTVCEFWTQLDRRLLPGEHH
jgi:hypothetical protein